MAFDSSLLKAVDAQFNAFSAILSSPDAPCEGPLSSVRVSIKDILEVAGAPTRWGSLSLEQAPPAVADCVAVARMRAAGASIVAKTTTTEFAHSPLGYSPLTGLTLNPWNTAYSCGGSSSGAGVAVATGATPLALATDAGCSTRLPAALTGTFGLKPTLGRIPHEKLPEAFATIVHLGLIANSVTLLESALAVTSGVDVRDPASLDRPPFIPVRTTDTLEGARILLWTHVGNTALDDDIRRSITDASAGLAGLGAAVFRSDYSLGNPDDCWVPLQQVGWGSRFGRASAQERGFLSPSFLEGIDAGTALSGVALNQALAKRTVLYRGVQSAFEAGSDFILTPCAAAPALAADHPVDAPLVVGGRDIGPIRREWIPYLSLFNLTGHPAISLPAGLDRNGVPIGIQLVGPWHAEAALLAVARQWERAFPPPTLPSHMKKEISHGSGTACN